MNIPCTNPAQPCEADEGLLTGVSSGRTDSQIFLGMNSGSRQAPPALGTNWSQSDATLFCESTTSQDEADQCGQRDQVAAIADANGVSYYTNAEQSYSLICDDGSTFTYIVPDGTFAAFSQEEADETAYSYAKNQAILTQICISDLSDTNAIIEHSDWISATVDGINPPYTPEVVDGSLPTGMGLTADGDKTFSIIGIPTVLGTFGFTIRVTDPEGNFSQKSFEITVKTS